MKKLISTGLLFIALAPFYSFVSFASNEESITWHSWSNELFERAQAENKFVILDLEAVWCHWCHVMEHETYGNSEVIKLMNDKYIAVRVDQDQNPDLLSRYGDWGWPATIVFNSDGTEIVRRRGYIPPLGMVGMLKAIIDDPSPGPSVFAADEVVATNENALSKAQKEIILERYHAVYDAEFGGWGRPLKFIDAGSMEYALGQAEKGNKFQEILARQTLQGGRSLIDPEWGGIYQYSDRLDWSSPHFEKIMSFQATAIKTYSRMSLLLDDDDYLTPALAVYHYLRDHLLSPEGSFYTSQDADLNLEIDGHKYFDLNSEERFKLGIPEIDKNKYARDNGWVIEALTHLYAVNGDQEILAIALKAANWVIENRSLGNGGFSHEGGDTQSLTQPFLGDTLAMGRAMLALYSVTADRQWLQRARDAATMIDNTFKDNNEGGYITTDTVEGSIGVFKKAAKTTQDNIAMMRFANNLFHYTGDKTYKGYAQQAFKFLGSDAVTGSRRFLAELVQADEENHNDPAHITIVGKKDDPAAQKLFAAAIKFPLAYKRVEWWDKREGAMPNPDVTYPELEKAAAFACANRSCSLPVFEGKDIAQAVNRSLLVDDSLSRFNNN